MTDGKLLAGKRVVVTGGAQGMGRAIVLLLAAQGAAVAFCDIDDEKAAITLADAQALHPGCFHAHFDMASHEQVDAFCALVKQRFGHIDVLVNVVGVNQRQTLLELDMDVFNRILDIDLKSMLRMCKHFLPGMAAAGGGSVVSISSIHSLATVPGNTAYAASKGGMNALNRAIAMDYAGKNIRANVICPGGIYTSELRPYWEGRTEEKLEYSYLLAHQPMNGPGLADDVANTVLFLASDMSSYVTGTTLLLDGGAALQAHRVERFFEPDDYEEIIEIYRVELDKSRGGGP